MAEFFVISVFLTERCNLQCKHCLVSSSQDAPILSPSELELFVEKLINFFNYLNFMWNSHLGKDIAILLDLTGGEPFLYGGDLLARICEKLLGVPFIRSITVSTNLMYGNEVLKFVKSGLPVNLCTSYDYDIRFRSIEEEKKWLKNYLKMRELGCEPEIEIVVTTPFLKNAQKVVEFFELHSIKKLSFNYPFPSGRVLLYVDELFPSLKEVSDFLINLFKVKVYFREYTLSLIEEICNGYPGKFPYGCCLTKLHVRPDGKIYAGEECMNLPPLNLTRPDNSSWWKLFFDRYFSFFTAFPSECRSCDYLSMCLGGCTYLRSFLAYIGKGCLLEGECTGMKSFLDCVFNWK